MQAFGLLLMWGFLVGAPVLAAINPGLQGGTACLQECGEWLPLEQDTEAEDVRRPSEPPQLRRQDLQGVDSFSIACLLRPDLSAGWGFIPYCSRRDSVRLDWGRRPLRL